MNQIRFSNLHNTSSVYCQTFTAGLETEAVPTNPNANQGVDEFVFNPSSGTFASIQYSPSLTSLLNDNNRSCSFVI